MISTPALVTVTAHRILRVGVCPVLEMTVTYPHLETDAPASNRFNETYRDLAESFMAWAETAPYEEAKAAFADLGASAPYRFDRRRLLCSMTAAVQGQVGVDKGERGPTYLAVTRTVRLLSRRGEVAERSVRAVDLWRWPELTAERRRVGAGLIRHLRRMEE